MPSPHATVTTTMKLHPNQPGPRPFRSPRHNANASSSGHSTTPIQASIMMMKLFMR